MIHQLHRGKFALYRIGVFRITDTAADLAHIVADPGVLLTTNANRPVHRRAAADLFRPLRRGLAEIIGKNKGRSRRISTTDNRDL